MGFVENGLANYTHGSRKDNKDLRDTYKQRFTCRPNCSNENGGPPYVKFQKHKNLTFLKTTFSSFFKLCFISP